MNRKPGREKSPTKVIPLHRTNSSHPSRMRFDRSIGKIREDFDELKESLAEVLGQELTKSQENIIEASYKCLCEMIEKFLNESVVAEIVDAIVKEFAISSSGISQAGKVVQRPRKSVVPAH